MDEDNVTKPSYRKSEKTQKEDERRKSIMGQSHDEMEWFPKMLGIKSGLGQFCEHDRRNLQQNSENG